MLLIIWVFTVSTGYMPNQELVPQTQRQATGHTELTCDTADTTRHEPTEPADLTTVLDIVPVLGKHLFL